MTCTHNHSCGCGSLSNANIKAVIEGLLTTALDEKEFDALELKNSIYQNLLKIGDVQDKLNDFKADTLVNLSGFLTRTELESIKSNLENLIAQQQNIYEDLQRDYESATNQKLLDYKSDVQDIQQEVSEQLNTVQNQIASLVPTRDAYKIAVQNGFVGSEASWLDSLKGHSAFTIAKAHGFRGSEAEWLTTLKGDKGPVGEKGIPGKDGVSAYEVAKNNGFVGNESQWLKSLIGEKGDRGVGVAHVNHNSDDTLTFLFTDNTSYTTGSLKGIQGVKGDSAYQVAKKNGFIGSEEQWLSNILAELRTSTVSEVTSHVTVEADRAESAAERAETFLTEVEEAIGLSAAAIYKDVATGLAATEDTDNFWVVPNAEDDLENLTLYNNNASEAVKLYEFYHLESYMIEEGSIKPSLIGE